MTRSRIFFIKIEIGSVKDCEKFLFMTRFPGSVKDFMSQVSKQPGELPLLSLRRCRKYYLSRFPGLSAFPLVKKAADTVDMIQQFRITNML